MKLDPLLSKAARLAKKRDYEGALKILQDEEDRYSGSFKYYYLYAVICLHSGGFVDAIDNFRFAERIKLKDPSTMLGLAVYHLKHLNTVKAVDYYLDVLETDPKNKTAKNALAIIRKHSDAEALSDWITPEKLAKLYPPIPSPSVNPKTILTVTAVLAVAFIVVFGITSGIKAHQRNQRQTADLILSSQERNAPIEAGGLYMYILSRDQAVSLYETALSLFTSYRDEAAKKNINKILASNASEALKNRARQMLEYTEVPGFDNFKKQDNPSFSDVENEPVLYRDVHVIWRGMATNVNVTDEGTSFVFLVGYDTRTTLEGTISVVFNKPVAINSERPLEVLGKIALSGASGASFNIRLEGVAVHQSGRLEQ